MYLQSHIESYRNNYTLFTLYLKNKTAALAMCRRMGKLVANSELESFTK